MNRTVICANVTNFCGEQFQYWWWFVMLSNRIFFAQTRNSNRVCWTDVDNNQLSANTIITSRWYRKYWEKISSICWIHSHSTKRLTCSLPLTFHIIVTSLNSDCGLCIMKRQKSLFYKLFTARWYANWQCLLTSNLRLAQLDWKIKPVLRLCFLNHFYLHTIICFRQTNMREHLNRKQYLNVFVWCVVWRLFSQFNLRLCFCNVKKILRWVDILAMSNAIGLLYLLSPHKWRTVYLSIGCHSIWKYHPNISVLCSLHSSDNCSVRHDANHWK